MSDLVKRLRANIAPSHADCQEAAARIEQLEARVAAADKLAEAMKKMLKPSNVDPKTWDRADTALAAYEATKEQSE